jgi:D-inositol-3-phosphate glycosyltransferase
MQLVGLRLMKIMIISYWTCPWTRFGELSAGGLNVYVVNLANHLARLGHFVDVYTRKHKEEEDRRLKIEKKVRLIHLSQDSPDLFKDTHKFADKILQSMKKNRFSYDIIYAHFYYSGLVGIVLRERLFLPLFFTFHSLGIRELDVDLKYPEREIKEKAIAERVDKIIASTDFERKDLIQYYQAQKEKIVIIPPGVEHGIFKKYPKNDCRKRLDLPSNEKIILFVGRIDPNKGISFLVKAVKKLISKYSFRDNLQVLLIGGNIKARYFWSHPEVKRLKILISENALSCCVKFIGSKPYDLLPYYYCASDIVVVPSIYESFGLVILEALACGSCIVASKVGGVPDLIEDKVDGRLFEKGNIVQLSRILNDLLCDEKEMKRLGDNGMFKSKLFSWEKQAGKVIEVFQDYL